MMGTVSPVASLSVLGEHAARPQTVCLNDWNPSPTDEMVAHHLVSTHRLIPSYPLQGVGRHEHWFVVRSLLALVGSDVVRTPPHAAG